ncbi:serine/threonine-protein kinase [Pseudomarimonas arenosa]|uniref:Serine/threonine protein kinase n=1 Tax=Pseudomarimonas arenosa TaxID=2774145 RepID=A0AAW3ZPU7_9GAMM|nr:serine/threonine-protein kinase [Pseudomarimonas arenosa]MBD8526960.1 serine/threonine protein kinase [Pseudomarimonas arenosa]
MSGATERPADDAYRASLDALLCELLDLDAGARAQRLVSLDPDRRRQIEALLAAAFGADDKLQVGGAMHPDLLEHIVAEDEHALQPGTRLGAYRVLQEIGVGGMGRVFLAERADGLFARRVALKLLPVHATPRELQRLQREQRILASLVHPGIARLYDAGISDQGAPYLVMEHVDGETIDVWCEHHAHGARARLQLLIEVCRAVESAHQHLIVHCDIKPANILVSAEGQAKLLDFGIARLLGSDPPGDPKQGDQGDGDASGHTTGSSTGAWLTPRYASPELRAGRAPTTASDIYQLGLLAGELLGAASRGSSQGRRDALPRTDLEAILARAVAERPADRYASVERLREDFERLQQGLPVSARRPGALYRLQRLAGRRPFTLAAAGVGVLVLLLISALFVTRLAAERDARRAQAEQAERARAEAEQVVAFLVDLFRSGDPYSSSDATPTSALTADVLLARAADRIGPQLDQQPLVRARLLAELGRIHRILGHFERAEPLLRESMALLEANPDANRLQLADVRLSLARLLDQRGGFDEASTLLDAAEAQFRQVGDRERLASALEARGNLLLDHQDVRSIATLQASLALWQALGNIDREADLHLFLANALAIHDRLTEARPHREAALALVEARLGPGHPTVANALVGLADQFQKEGHPADSVALLERAISIYDQHFGEADFRLATALNNLGTTLSDLGRQEAARQPLQRALIAYRQGQPDHPAIGTILNNLGTIHWHLADPNPAAEHYRQALDHLRPRLRADHPMIALVEFNLGEALLALGDARQARPLLESALVGLEKHFGPRHSMLVPGLDYLAGLDRKAGALRQAEARMRRALAIREADPQGDQAALTTARAELAALQAMLRK